MRRPIIWPRYWRHCREIPDFAEARRLPRIESREIADAARIDNDPGWLGIRLASAKKRFP
ncbi:hypothetical protein MesoLjLc_72100 [Mesorhizobium sp. L-8-10]|nr:hypothetical protein MesoLjLc_72100 [Mesorhizobium sp. L-8-10]